MNFSEIDAFLTVAQYKSFSKAAEVLFLTQSTVSRRLQSLEKKLGASLIQRNKGTRDIQLTFFGENFVNVAERWRTLLKDTYQAPHPDSLSMTIGASESLNNSVLSELYLSLYKHPSSIGLRIRTHQSVDLYRLIEHKEYDVAFTPREMVVRNVIAKPLFCEPIVVLRRSSPEFSSKPVIDHTDLNPEYEILINWFPNYLVWHDRIWDPFTSRTIDIETTSLIPKLLTNPKQWVLVPSTIATPWVQSGDFVMQTLSDPPPNRTIFLLTHRHPSQATSKAIDILLTVAKSSFTPYLQKFGLTTYL